MRFDVHRTIALADKFAWTGPGGESHAADLLAEEFARAKLRVERFEVESSSTDPDWFLLILAVLSGFFAYPIARGWSEAGRLGITTLAVTLPLVALAGRVLVGRARPLRSSLVVGSPADDSEAPVRVLMLARLVAPVSRRALAWRYWFARRALELMAALVIAAAFDLRAWVMPALLLALWVDLALLVFLPWKRARQPGVGDNRTGPAMLAEFARGSASERVEYRFAATGPGAGGPRELARLIKKEWPKKPTLVIHLEVPGLGGEISVGGWYFTGEMATDAARDLQIPHGWRKNGPFDEYRLEPFSEASIPRVCLIGNSAGDRIEPAMLSATEQLATEVALRFSKRMTDRGDKNPLPRP